jgi:hypothetical protein
MRSRSGLVLIAAAALLTGSAADAGVLTAATWTQTIQGVDLTVTNNAATCTSVGANLVQQSITCPAAGLGATGSSGGGNYSVSLTMAAFALDQFTIGGPFNIHTKARFGPGAQNISGNGNSAGATVGIPGNVTVKVAAHIGQGVYASFLAPAVTTLVRVPLSVGKAGAVTGFFYVLGSREYITVDFYAWTPNTLSFTGLTLKGAALPDVVAKGSFMMTEGVGAVCVSKVSFSHAEAHLRHAHRTRAVHASAARRRRGGHRARRDPQAQLAASSRQSSGPATQL